MEEYNNVFQLLGMKEYAGPRNARASLGWPIRSEGLFRAALLSHAMGELGSVSLDLPFAGMPGSAAHLASPRDISLQLRSSFEIRYPE